MSHAYLPLTDFYDVKRDQEGHRYIQPLIRGFNLTRIPLLNKGTAFTEQEREELGLEGLLAPQIDSLEALVERAYREFQRRSDPIDRHILAELQVDGRMTNVELAKRVGISAPPCLRRVRTLEEQGFIRGYHADVDPRSLGFEVQVFAMVRLSRQAEADLSAFEARCKGWPLVRECHMLNGEIDFILKCVAPDLSTFQAFLTEELTAAANVASVKTSLTIRTSKNLPGVPLPAFACGRKWKSSSVCTCGSTTSRTEPPLPPLPPSGPPSGLNFSRCTDEQPWPPLPAAT